MMLLCIDVGNTHIYAGIFVDDTIRLRFRLTTQRSTSDELGVFLRAALRDNNCAPEQIANIGICSVVPQIDYSLRAACIKYFSIEPFFLHADAQTGIDIKYRNKNEVGADRVANAIAAVHQFPCQNLIIIDFGTATTFCVINKEKSYLGGTILPGVRLSVDALSKNTAKLPTIEIVKSPQVVGRSTSESIQAGIFYGVIGSCRELIQRIKKEIFFDEHTRVLATGGFATLFENEDVYDLLVPDLVLDGIKLGIEMNPS